MKEIGEKSCELSPMSNDLIPYKSL